MSPQQSPLSQRHNAAIKKPAKTKPAPKPDPALSMSKKNHVAKKVNQKLSIPALLGKSGRVAKSSAKRTLSGKLIVSSKNSVDKQIKACRILEQLKLNRQQLTTSGQYLSRLPPRTPYQSLLLALSQASKPVKTPPLGGTSPQQQYIPPSTTHTHSVFHDHFALLSDTHVPSEFAAPVKSLPLQLPIRLYTSCMCGRVAQAEHSYAKASSESDYNVPSGQDVVPREEADSKQFNLKLSLPRSLLHASESEMCGCDKGPLVFCTQCHSLYHSVCSSSTMCSTCVTLKSLNLS